MNKELMKFWLTCPDCKRKFGVSPAIVIKYVDRLFDQVGKEITEKSEKVAKRADKEAAEDI